MSKQGNELNVATSRPEIVIGLVGALGTDLAQATQSLAEELRGVRYEPHIIKLTDLLLQTPEFKSEAGVQNKAEDERIDKLMTLGDDFRRLKKRGDAVALLALLKIRDIRSRKAENPDVPLQGGHAFILHSLKHPDEIASLKAIYGSAFVLVSVYSPKSKREQDLAKRFAFSRKEYQSSVHLDRARALIMRDEKERGVDLGQNVEDAFPLADFFADATNDLKLKEQISRFVKILFRYPYATPTKDEYGMFFAKAAALRSSDLARQVGAVVTTEDGEIVSTGCNEVPKPQGGAVWADVDKLDDNRDFQLGHDSTGKWKREIVGEILEKIQQEWLVEDLRSLSKEELARKALDDGARPPLKGTRADGILEFGRVVHAEMTALTDAARRGRPLKDETLYCTTFPCHMCARHIIAAGIKRVVYVEPYPKSLTKDLYGDIVRIDFDEVSRRDAVRFEPFVGVAPRRYIEFYEMDEGTQRKDKRGLVVTWDKTSAMPRVNKIQLPGPAEMALLEKLTVQNNEGLS